MQITSTKFIAPPLISSTRTINNTLHHQNQFSLIRFSASQQYNIPNKHENRHVSCNQRYPAMNLIYELERFEKKSSYLIFICVEASSIYVSRFF